MIHENRGLNPYIEDVARRLATEGYTAFAPDALTPVGGYPGDEDRARDMFAGLDGAKVSEDLAAAVDYVKLRPDFNGKVGAVGFCFGGAIVNTIATRVADLAAAVPYYGAQPPAAEAARIKSPMLLHYASTDPRINAGWPAFEALLKANHNRKLRVGRIAVNPVSVMPTSFIHSPIGMTLARGRPAALAYAYGFLEGGASAQWLPTWSCHQRPSFSSSEDIAHAANRIVSTPTAMVLMAADVNKANPSANGEITSHAPVTRSIPSSAISCLPRSRSSSRQRIVPTTRAFIVAAFWSENPSNHGDASNHAPSAMPSQSSH